MSRWLKKLALAGASALLALLALEVAVRVVGYDLDIEKEMRFHPTLGWTMDAKASRIERVNSDGFRFPPVSREKPPGVRRALVLGDSFAAGTSFPYDYTLPGQLQGALERTGASWQVVSLSVGDWGNAQELIALREYGFAFEPDVVVLQLFPFNDLCNDGLELADTCSLRDYLRPYIATGPAGVETTYQNPWRAFFRRHSLLFGFAENRLLWRERRAQGLDPGNPKTQGEFFKANAARIGIPYGGALASLLPESAQSEPVKAGWETMGTILAEMKRELDSRSIPMVGLVIPYAWTLPPMWNDYGRSLPGLQPDYDTARVEGFLSELGIPAVSARTRIVEGPWQSSDYFFLPLDAHLNAFGTATMAAWIVEEMRRLGLVASSNGAVLEAFDALDPSLAPPAFYNFTAVEPLDGRRVVYVYGPAGRAAFVSPRAGLARLEMEMTAEAPELRVRLQSGPEDPGQAYTFAAVGDSQSVALDWPATPGRNEIRVSCSNWIGKDQSGSSQRRLAVRFEKFQITLPPP